MIVKSISNEAKKLLHDEKLREFTLFLAKKISQEQLPMSRVEEFCGYKQNTIERLFEKNVFVRGKFLTFETVAMKSFFTCYAQNQNFHPNLDTLSICEGKIEWKLFIFEFNHLSFIYTTNQKKNKY